MAREKTKTSRLTTYRVKNSLDQGFTLIEVMIVVVILGGIAVLGLSQFSKNNTQIKSTVRKISVLTKELHNAARMSNRTYRLVFQMDAESGYAVWVESAPKGIILGADAFNEEVKKDKDKNKDEKSPPPPFSADTSVLRGPIKLPSNIIIKDIEFSGQEKQFSSGKSYIYFMPEGLTQEAAIHLTDKKDLNWTIVINPITGQSRIISEERPLKDLRTE